ncbi:MAG: CvpA family protein [Anaerolineales bacterium]|jgi:uncharacterized membrane protein required for colicin V production|nr:CvpA family protein [Anaerolineales bacterium]
MVSLAFLFYFMIFILGIVGLMRGWARELLVTFSVILAIFIIYILELLLPESFSSLNETGREAYFWFRAAILIVLVIFGYQTPNLQKFAGPRFVRERLADSLLGLVLGALNGYLIIGTLWHYMHVAMYPFTSVILPPNHPSNPFPQLSMDMINFLPPVWLQGTPLYVVVAIAFAFVIIVLI